MFRAEYDVLAATSKAKLNLLNTNPLGYFTASMIAGMFISFGSFVAMSIGGIATAAGSTSVKFLTAFVFAAALSLVVMAGCELFTGNNLVMAAGSFRKEVSWGDSCRLWIVCWIGNLVGSWITVLIYQLTGITGNAAIAEFFAATAETKCGLTPTAMFTRAILCNICVCLAIWCGARMKSESGKLIMIAWCILIFMICGFEHSIANMSIIGVGLLNAGEHVVTWGAYFTNLGIVTLGNMAGGIFFVALPYLVISQEK